MPKTVLLACGCWKTGTGMVETRLRERGHVVLKARNAFAALGISACRPVDLLVATEELGGMSGPQLAGVLGRRFPGLPVLLMSAEQILSGGDPVEEIERLLASTPRKDAGSLRNGEAQRQTA